MILNLDQLDWKGNLVAKRACSFYTAPGGGIIVNHDVEADFVFVMSEVGDIENYD